MKPILATLVVLLVIGQPSYAGHSGSRDAAPQSKKALEIDGCQYLVVTDFTADPFGIAKELRAQGRAQGFTVVSSVADVPAGDSFKACVMTGSWSRGAYGGQIAMRVVDAARGAVIAEAAAEGTAWWSVRRTVHKAVTKIYAQLGYTGFNEEVYRQRVQRIPPSRPKVVFAGTQTRFWMPQPEKSQKVDSSGRGVPFLVDETESHRIEVTLVQLGQDGAVRVSVCVENKTAEALLVKADDLHVSMTLPDGSGVSSSRELVRMSSEEVLALYDRAKLPVIDYRVRPVALPPGPPPLLFGSGFAQGYLTGLYLKQQGDYEAALASGAGTDAYNAKVSDLNQRRQKINELLDQEKAKARELLDTEGWTDMVVVQGKPVTKVAAFELPGASASAARVCLNVAASAVCGAFKPLEVEPGRVGQ